MGEPKISQEARDAAARAVSWVTDSPPKPKPEFASMWEGDLAEVMQSLINSTLERAAAMAVTVGAGQAEGWTRNPGADDSGRIAASNTAHWIAISIRGLKDA